MHIYSAPDQLEPNQIESLRATRSSTDCGVFVWAPEKRCTNIAARRVSPADKRCVTHLRTAMHPQGEVVGWLYKNRKYIGLLINTELIITHKHTVEHTFHWSAVSHSSPQAPSLVYSDIWPATVIPTLFALLRTRLGRMDELPQAHIEPVRIACHWLSASVDCPDALIGCRPSDPIRRTPPSRSSAVCDFLGNKMCFT